MLDSFGVRVLFKLKEGEGFIKPYEKETKITMVYKIILFDKNMMRYDAYAMMMHKRKRTNNYLLGILPGTVTIDTTNKEPSPEVPRQPKGELVKLLDLLVPC